MQVADFINDVHYIEYKYKSLTKVSPDNVILKHLQDKTCIDKQTITPPRHQQLESNKTHNWAVKQQKYYTDKVIDLAKQGYSIEAIKCMTHSGYNRIHTILQQNNITIPKMFKYRFQGVYVQTLANLHYWGITGTTYNRLKVPLECNCLDIQKHNFRWGELPKGAKYMLMGNNEKIYVKE